MSDIATELYLDLLKRCLLNLIYQDQPVRYIWDASPSSGVYGTFDR
jgi:hypothetical protein